MNLPDPQKVIEFFRGYPSWVWMGVVLCAGISGMLLIYGRSPVENGEGGRIFADRAALLRESHLEDVLATSDSFDMVAFSANVFKNYQDRVIGALNRGARIRLIIYDPGSANTSYYDDTAKLIGETPAIKRNEAYQLLTVVEQLRRRTVSGERRGSLELRFLSGKPLFYNLWVSNAGRPGQCAHLSTYFYRGLQLSPSIRVCQDRSDFASRIAAEFEEVWTQALAAPSS